MAKVDISKVKGQVTKDGEGNEISGARILTGLAQDEAKRASQVSKIRNAAKANGTVMLTRGDHVFVCKDEDTAEQVRKANPVSGRGRKRDEAADSLVTFS